MLGVIGGLVVSQGFVVPSAMLAQSTLAPAPDPLSLEELEAGAETSAQPGKCRSLGEVVTSDTTCQNYQTIPSFWWAREQFGGQLLENWIAHTADSTSGRRVDLVVNPQAWSLLDYLERYEFINHFGTVARDYGYNLRVFNRQGVSLAAYTCDFRVAAVTSGAKASAPTCQILLDATGKDILRGRTRTK